MNTNEVKIAILSQNAVSDKNTKPITVTGFEDLNPKPEIYIEMTQEDTRKLPVMNPKFLEAESLWVARQRCQFQILLDLMDTRVLLKQVSLSI
jgi:hypothetical protein